MRLGTRNNRELYDLSTDRTEQHDISEQHPNRTLNLYQQWHAWALNANVLPRPEKRKKPYS